MEELDRNLAQGHIRTHISPQFPPGGRPRGLRECVCWGRVWLLLR